MRVFHTSISWWFSTGIWMIANPSSLQNTNSGRSQQYCGLDGPYISANFQVLHSLYQSFGDCTENTNNNWYHLTFMFDSFFSIFYQGPGIYLPFHLPSVFSVVSRNGIVITIICMLLVIPTFASSSGDLTVVKVRNSCSAKVYEIIIILILIIIIIIIARYRTWNHFRTYLF